MSLRVDRRDSGSPVDDVDVDDDDVAGH